MLLTLLRRAALVGLAIPALLISGSGLAATDLLEELESYYAEVNTLQGRFEQQTLDERGQVVDSSQGEFAISRPDRFHWSYAAPFAQEIVADGEKLWVYDVELDQVTVRKQANALGNAPAQLLAGDYASLTEAFEVEAGAGFVRLTPITAGQVFDEARIGMRDGYPYALEIDDALGQTTRVELFDVQINEAVEEQRFRFEPPENADVYSADEARALR